jgi:hypothetical protein
VTCTTFPQGHGFAKLGEAGWPAAVCVTNGSTKAAIRA